MRLHSCKQKASCMIRCGCKCFEDQWKTISLSVSFFLLISFSLFCVCSSADNPIIPLLYSLVSFFLFSSLFLLLFISLSLFLSFFSISVYVYVYFCFFSFSFACWKSARMLRKSTFCRCFLYFFLSSKSLPLHSLACFFFSCFFPPKSTQKQSGNLFTPYCIGLHTVIISFVALLWMWNALKKYSVSQVYFKQYVQYIFANSTEHSHLQSVVFLRVSFSSFLSVSVNVSGRKSWLIFFNWPCVRYITAIL